MHSLTGDSEPFGDICDRRPRKHVLDGSIPLFHHAHLHQHLAECHAGPETGQPAVGDVVQSFCTSSRRLATGRTRRRLGARPSLRWRSDSGHATRPSAGADSGNPRGRRRRQRRGRLRFAGRQPAWARRPSHAAPLGESPPAVVGMRREGCGAAPPASRVLRIAARQPCGPPLTPEPLRPLGPALPAGGGLPVMRAPHPHHGLVARRGVPALERVVKVSLTR